MNFDILIKLVKLANHNNADGEANAAARKVCKMLSEDNYKWIEKAIKGGPKVAADKAGTWSGFDRSAEPDFRSTRQSTYRSPFDDNFADWFKKWGSQFSEEAERKNEEAERRYKEEQARRNEYYKQQEERKKQNESEYARREPFRGRGFNPFSYWDHETYERVDPKTGQRQTAKEYYDNQAEQDRKDKKTSEQKQADERKRQKREESKKKWEEWEKNRGPKGEGPINYTFNQKKEGAKGYKKIYTERIRRCVTCGYDKLTTDETPAYVCSSCKRSTP